ncbi:MAG TPA: hypothetical protein VMY77_16460 [Chitinophagaceae bacterium]|nr:hypothetical protein [Chitinophagaceae bacterium]
MKFSAEILEELNSISPLLAGIEKKNVFSVPDGYFDMLLIETFKKINNNSESRVDNLTVPEGYFENLSTSILNKIKELNESAADELRKLSPMLYSIQNENVFEVPAGYFRNLEYEILDKVRPQIKVVEMKRRDSIWKYAAAAVVTGVIGLSSLLMFNTQQSTKSNEGMVITDGTKFENEKQINGAIATLSDEEIIKYLEKTGTDVDNEALASGIDANALPESTDYMLDEKTLDTYLETDKNSQN